MLWIFYLRHCRGSALGYEKLKTLYPETEFVNLPMTHSWGQQVVRFYDLDGNLIEVGTPM